MHGAQLNDHDHSLLLLTKALGLRFSPSLCPYWEKIEKRFSIFEFRLGINFSHFRLRCFEEVGERLGSPVAGVEIGTG